MFNKGEKLVLTIMEGGSEVTHYQNVVMQYEDGLLKVRNVKGVDVIYNVRSLAFIKAQKDN